MASQTGVHVNTYCVDQGAFRSSALADLISRDRDAMFVIPDSAILEMCKADRWESTLRTSLVQLASVPDRVLFALGHGECFRKEIASRAPLSMSDLIAQDETSWGRDLLIEIAEDRSGRGIGMISTMIREVQEDLHQTTLNHDANLEALRALIGTIDPMLKPDFKRRLRSGEVSKLERLDLATAITPDALEAFGSGGGFTAREFQGLLAGPSFIVRYVWLRIGECLNWMALGGIENVDPAKITNSEIDRHYILVSSYCSAFLSKDKRALEIESDLRAYVGGRQETSASIPLAGSESH